MKFYDWFNDNMAIVDGEIMELKNKSGMLRPVGISLETFERCFNAGKTDLPPIFFLWFLSVVGAFGIGHIVGDIQTRGEIAKKLDNCHMILRGGK